MRTLALSKIGAPTGTPRSLIKPHLLNLSGSGSMLNGIVVERDLERASSGVGEASTPPSKHVIVIHSDRSARLEWRIDGRCRTSRFLEGDAIVNPAGLFAAPRWEADVQLLLLALEPALLNRVAEATYGQSSVELVPRFHFRDELLRQLACNLVAEFEQAATPDRLYAQSLTHALVAHLLRKHSMASGKWPSAKGGLPPRTLARVKDYLQAHLSETLDLEAMAAVAGLSPSHFTALFKQSTGLAPYQYVIAERIEKAKGLLIRTKLPIAEIAWQAGFADQSHLTRLMRRFTGLTPKAVRGG
jgi:AraC family transcriptional regulator